MEQKAREEAKKVKAAVFKLASERKMNTDAISQLYDDELTLLAAAKLQTQRKGTHDKPHTFASTVALVLPDEAKTGDTLQVLPDEAKTAHPYKKDPELMSVEGDAHLVDGFIGQVDI